MNLPSMFDNELAYLRLLSRVMFDGEVREDRTGTGTISLFGESMEFDLTEYFPLLTTKQMAAPGIISELLWFIEGSGDERRLAEIRWGTRDPSKKTIWTDNAKASYWLPKAKFEGDLGRVYGVQWRKWQKITIDDSAYDNVVHHTGGAKTIFKPAKVKVEHVDQLANIINSIKNNPTDRRMILTAFNVGELDQMALPPCHMFAQFYVRKSDYLDCQVYIRSNDLFLGAPFNIASYALLVHMIAQVTGKKAGRLKIVIGDAHIYLNHVDQVKEQLSREILQPPKLTVDPTVTSIDGFTMDSFSFGDTYKAYPPIKGAMAV